MEGETLPRLDSKSRMFGNVKYPRKHRIPGYAQKAAFFHLEIVTRCASLQYYTILVYVSVLVGAVHLRLFPIFKAHFRCQVHLLDTIYCVHASHCTYIQCTCLLPRLLAALAVRAAVWPCSPPCAPVPVCAPADAWSTVDFFVRRPCPCGRAPSGPIASGRSSCLRPCLPARVACLLPLFASFYSPIMAHFIRLYGSFSRRASARWTCRKLF